MLQSEIRNETQAFEIQRLNTEIQMKNDKIKEFET